MTSDISTDSATIVRQQRSTLLQNLRDTAQASQQAATRNDVAQLSDDATNLRSINSATGPAPDIRRGSNLDLTV